MIIRLRRAAQSTILPFDLQMLIRSIYITIVEKNGKSRMNDKNPKYLKLNPLSTFFKLPEHMISTLKPILSGHCETA